MTLRTLEEDSRIIKEWKKEDKTPLLENIIILNLLSFLSQYSRSFLPKNFNPETHTLLFKYSFFDVNNLKLIGHLNNSENKNKTISRLWDMTSSKIGLLYQFYESDKKVR